MAGHSQRFNEKTAAPLGVRRPSLGRKRPDKNRGIVTRIGGLDWSIESQHAPYNSDDHQSIMEGLAR
jgi:hypothetical protein